MAEQHEVAGADAPVSVAICALTLQRPVGLAALLEGLTRLEVPPAQPAGPYV